MPPVLLAYGLTAGAGALGGLAYRAGFQLVGSMKASREREREREVRWRSMQEAARQAAREKKNAQARVRRARKKQLALETAAGSQLLVLNEANDLAVLDAPAKTRRKIQVQTTVPLVRATSFAEPISQELTESLGIREMVFAVVWQLTHHRDDPAPDRYDTGGAIAGSDREAFDILLALAGIAHDEARQLRLAWDQVGDPLTLIERLQELKRGRFEAQTVEFLLPIPPLARRQILGS